MKLILVFIAVFSVPAAASKHPCQRPCIAGQTMTCQYNFTVEWYRTLSKACYDCPFNVTDCFRPQCVSADGKVRALVAINRQVPGPAINRQAKAAVARRQTGHPRDCPVKVCEGDEVEVAVTNLLEDGLTTSIHWHGQHVFKTPYFDGVGQITQCNIQYLERFVYKFRAYPPGTHWYHSHTGMQMADGSFGPLIVRQPANHDPNDVLYDLDLPEHVLMLYDWQPELSMASYMKLMHVFDGAAPRSILVNGRGRKYNVTNEYGLVETSLTHAQTPLEVLHVQRGRKYRLRVIGVSPVCPLQVSVDGHQLMVISVDGEPLVPRVLDAFIIHPGERYDFVLTADKPVDNYWLRVLGIGDCEASKANGRAVLRYEGAAQEEPTADPNTQRDGILLNPILFDGNVTMYGFNRTVILTDEMQYYHKSNYTDEQVDFKYIIGMDYNNNDNTKYNNKELYPVQKLKPRMFHATPVMDNITFLPPPVPLLSEWQDVDTAWFCNRSTLVDPDYCLDQDLCMCTHLINVPLGKVVELIVFHEGRFFAERGHDMHLHGHSFRVLGVGKVSPSLPRAVLEELDARGELRRNYIQPPVRDTVNVPDGGYVIIRFTASNPGFWLFHCHTDTHLAQGMALLIRVGDYSDLPPVPSEFPRCGGMGFSNSHRQPKGEETACPTSSAPAVPTSSFIALSVVCLVLITARLFAR